MDGLITSLSAALCHWFLCEKHVHGHVLVCIFCLKLPFSMLSFLMLNTGMLPYVV